MSMEWFDRVSSELQEHLESICEKYDQAGQMSVERSSRHPRIEFFVETDEEGGRDYFCTLFFDPHNEEFYIEGYDLDLEQPARTILPDIDNIIDAVHESFHEYMNGDDEYEDNGLEDIDDLVDDDDVTVIAYSDDEIYEEIDVEWETPEVTAFQIDDEVEVTYQFGVVHGTGDGVLRRVNRLWTEEDELVKDETNFIFTKEEAGTIIAMIASHMDAMKGYELDE
ncbi:hypothetical protein D1B31_05280 [Neobacillus notoginsengisoli]|uniref:Uncharacterized protein n=1 Tax=Neobacillus notoginsengisoli TaxID=1578198 RepID=A0A417YXC1_9BACI|nr:hypothetical protein [Neobacillus notoginsengisoli]RHW42055.1 hypothetical protein D1B31_05280 [Neobacillus notoginsengisoli]